MRDLQKIFPDSVGVNFTCLNGVESMVTMAPLTRVLVRTNSLLDAL